MKTIASLAKDCMQPPPDTFHSFSNYEKNKYTEDYHGDLLKLFEHEFQTLDSACRQRMGSEASCGFQNPDSSSVIGQELGEVFTSATVVEFCRRWRQSVRLACMDLLWMIRLSNAPEEAAETFWLVMDFVTEGPIGLFKRDLLRPEMILESSRMSVFLEPLPWLAVDAAKNEDCPFYLWDSRESRTVETEKLPLPLEYVARGLLQDAKTDPRRKNRSRTQEEVQAKFDELNDHLRNANVSDFGDWAKMKSFIDDADIPMADFAILDAEEILNIYTGAGSASGGLGSRAQFGPWKNLPLDIHYFRAMLQATRMLGLGELRSRMDILAIGERRTCMMGRSYDKSPSHHVGSRSYRVYPAAFVAEVRNKAGHADFFRSRTLNKRALGIIRDWQNHTALDSSKYVSIGSLLPFSNSSVSDVFIAPITWPNDSLPLEGQSALPEWVINDDGSVYITKAAVVVNTSRSRPNAKFATLGASTPPSEREVLAGWLEEQKNISGSSYLVNLSRQRLCMKERMDWSSCHGVRKTPGRRPAQLSSGSSSLRSALFIVRSQKGTFMIHHRRAISSP
ncbi:hypothetical protein CSAL01_02665 [Colletotrichum salicis]|uniref:Uncharacterized protein n=1 Tax=Colletotrichum salicis TaxID=1209931 RepID=A0A135SK94_9PEZI|nr:hypothetical protein CSAL01_02665 [Colletotrichum salicis]